MSPPGRDGSNEPQAGTQGQETAGKRAKRGELPPSFDAPGANQRINWQTLQAIPPGGNCDEAATNEITRCIATLRAGSLRWAQHRMAAMEIRDEKDMETHQHISVERILEQQMQQLDLILTSNPGTKFD